MNVLMNIFIYLKNVCVNVFILNTFKRKRERVHFLSIECVQFLSEHSVITLL